MNGWLLDTNVISELRRQRTEPRVLAFVVAQKLDWLHVSDVTFAEIRFGIEQVIDPAQRAELPIGVTTELKWSREIMRQSSTGCHTISLNRTDV